MKPVAVVILNWNGAALLRRYLPSVIAGTSGELADVIVADNGSTDDSRLVMEKEFPNVKRIYFDKNYGFAEGYNRCIAQTRYAYTVLLNSDVSTPSGWLEPLYAYMEQHSDVGAVQPKLLQDREDGREVFEYAGAAGGFLDRHGYPYCRGRVFGTIEDDHGQYDAPTALPCFWASGACLMVRSALYESVGGLDAKFFAHMEEIDLCWRIRLAGKKLAVVTASRVYHLGGGSLPQGNARKTYLNFRNNLLMLHKNLPEREGRRIIFVRRLYDALALLQALVTLRMGDVKAIAKAHKDYRKMRLAYTAHPLVNLLRQSAEGRRNIVVDYYLKRKTKF